MFTISDDALDVRKYFFSNRVVSEWNCLSGEMLMLGFKKKLVWAYLDFPLTHQ